MLQGHLGAGPPGPLTSRPAAAPARAAPPAAWPRPPSAAAPAPPPSSSAAAPGGASPPPPVTREQGQGPQASLGWRGKSGSGRNGVGVGGRSGWTEGLSFPAAPLASRTAGADFPGGAVVKNPPANAGDTGSSPGPGGSHTPWSNEARAPQLLSLRSRAREPQLLSPHATTTEACAPRPHAPQQEKPPQ